MRVFVDAERTPELGASWAERWEGPDRGLVVAWLKGREMRVSAPHVVERIKAGALPVLAWRGGVERPIKATKTGALHYLAAVQGMLGEPLDLELDRDYTLQCATTGVTVVFTADVRRLLASADVEGGRDA